MPTNSNLKHLNTKDMSEAFRTAKAVPGLLAADDSALLFYDLAVVHSRLQSIAEAFPKGSLHAVAIKANPLLKVLQHLVKQGFGLEAASQPELVLAEMAGLPPQQTVFDSPAKTKEEIAYALQKGIRLNADSFEELERIDALLQNRKSNSQIGLRLNPQVGAGSIAATSVAGEYSKFGVPLGANKARLLNCFRRYSWLSGLHLHIGSQGCPVPMLVDGIGRVYRFALEINQMLEPLGRKLLAIDIGGGLPVAYHHGQEAPGMETFAEALRTACPGLFDGTFGLVTEFGRYVHAHAGWAASRVEYVKMEGSHRTLITHLGADFMLRKCYNPNDWHHEISLLDSEGFPKTGNESSCNIAGPLCFAGDFTAKDISLPPAAPGDYVLIHDVGAYTLGMWSRYNSRQMPKVIGYELKNKHFELLRKRDSIEDALKDWL